jgi:hypothetical protein
MKKEKVLGLTRTFSFFMKVIAKSGHFIFK